MKNREPYSGVPIGLFFGGVIVCILLAMILGCGPAPEPTETFRESACIRVSQPEVRQRRVTTTCALRSNGHIGTMPSVHPCLIWNHRTITEHRVLLSCQAEEWRQ